MLVAGGYNSSGGNLASANLYDPATGTWSATGALATARYYHTATLLPNGKVLVAGGVNGSGVDLASAELYDPATGTWSATGAVTARHVHTATLLPNGKVLVAGGLGDSGILASAELYDPATGTWSATGALATARYLHTATLLPSGKVLVAGGFGDSGFLASAELYDPATGTWSATGALATERFQHPATLLPSGKVLVAGGLHDLSGSKLASVELYSPASPWTALPPAPGPIGQMFLLTDGTVLAHQNDGTSNTSNVCYRLTPGSDGQYASGTWFTNTPIASMNDSRLYYAAHVLKNGRVFVAGGESGTGNKQKAEVYNPVANQWQDVTPTPAHTFSDASSSILPDGRMLVALVEGSLQGTLIFDPVANTWNPGATCRGIHNESTWLKLPDGSILMVDRDSTASERYIPSLDPPTGRRVADGTVPVALYDPYGSETGPAFLLPSRKALFIGSLGHTAIYSPSGSNTPGTWVAGPDIVIGLGGLGTPDAPGAMLPDGTILCAVSPVPTSGNHNPAPMYFYQYDPVGNWFRPATPTSNTMNHPSYYGTMLVLPDGTALYSDFSNQVYNYKPYGAPLAAGKPTIVGITPNADGSFHLTGTQLNGISEGSCFGDNNQNPTNYPIVRLTSGGGTVYYGRTYNWSNTGVMTGANNVSTEFTLPAGLPAGTYSLSAIANGIASNPVTFTPPTALESWRLKYFGTTSNTGNAADAADPDGDGFANLFEYVAGLDPTSVASHFSMTTAVVAAPPGPALAPGPAGQMAITFGPIVAGRTYVVTSKVSLAAPTWLPLTNFTTTDNGTLRTVTDLSATGGTKFFRVEISLP